MRTKGPTSFYRVVTLLHLLACPLFLFRLMLMTYWLDSSYTFCRSLVITLHPEALGICVQAWRMLPIRVISYTTVERGTFVSYVNYLE
jgi:hypothetical protein